MNNLSNLEKLLVTLIGAVALFIVAVETGYIPKPNAKPTNVSLPKKDAAKNQPKVNLVNSQVPKKVSESGSSHESKKGTKTPDKVNFNSRFIKEVTAEKYQSTDTPSKAPVFRWDFSKAGVVHTYEYEQEVQNKADMGAFTGGKRGGVGQEMSAKGLLLIKSQGNNSADLVLKDMKMSMKVDLGIDDKEPKTMVQQMPPVVAQAIKEDGSGSFGNTSQDALLRILFPLPPKELKVGESVDILNQMPFNAMGSLLNVTGRSRITLTRYVKDGKRTYAQLDVDTDVSELTVPEELEGEYKCSNKGKSVFFFDIESRTFVSGTVAMVMEFSIDAPMPKIEIPGTDASDMPKRNKMAMASDNLIRVKLKR